MSDLHVYADGSYRGKKRGAVAAYIIEDGLGLVVEERAERITVSTSTEAEYWAVLLGLRRAKELGATRVFMNSDCRSLVFQMRGLHKVRAPAIRELSLNVARLARTVERVYYERITRDDNVRADALARECV